jgi:hypothetical protein
VPARGDGSADGAPVAASANQRTELTAAANATTLRRINEAIEEGRVSDSRRYS